jgi:H+-translocating NAD(P) transhydrogenase subunit alpha
VNEMGGKEIRVDLDNDVIRPAVLVHEGERLPPPPKKEPAPAPEKATAPKPVIETPSATDTGSHRAPPPSDAKPQQTAIQSPVRAAWGSRLGGLVVIVLLFVLGAFAPEDFLRHFTVFILACFIGWQVIWSVTPALHTPLMSVTNAISGIIVVGGMVEIGPSFDLATIFSALAVLFASINVAGGFYVTQRMLRMFRRE